VVTRSRKQRIPQLKHTELRGIGWHVSYRDPESGLPRKHRFKVATKAQAEKAYHTWIASYLNGEPRSNEPESSAKSNAKQKKASLTEAARKATKAKAETGSLLHIGSGLIEYEQSRVRKEGEDRVPGSIAPRVAMDRRKAVQDFLGYLNERHGPGAVARLRLEDLAMNDVEAYNRHLVEAEFSSNTLNRKMQIIKKLIDRAGRPEYGQQVLPWNWDALDRSPGKAPKRKQLPTLEQLKKLLKAADARGEAMIWMGIGLGFGQSDLSALRVNDIDKTGYDLRRGKTGIDRYGETPPGVWRAIRAYLAKTPRPQDGQMFVTRKGQPLVHNSSDSILQWWNRLRESIGETKKTLDGFYVLRHLGATEFGSRKGCSISEMKRWLGHSASSSMADVYMRPVSPEHRKTIDWLRKQLQAKR